MNDEQTQNVTAEQWISFYSKYGLPDRGDRLTLAQQTAVEYVRVEAKELAKEQRSASTRVYGPGIFAQRALEAKEASVNPPEIIERSAFSPFGVPLSYAGELNSITGPGGVGKTNLSLLAAQQHDGYTLFGSFEKSERSLRASAAWLGVDTPDLLVARELDEIEALIEDAPTDASLNIVIDSMASALGQMGLDENSTEGVVKLETRMKRWLTSDSVHCVTILDHVGHSEKDRAKGSIRKHQMIQGSAWVCIQSGSKVTVACVKDNSGEPGKTFTYEVTRGGLTLVDTVAAAQAVEDAKQRHLYEWLCSNPSASVNAISKGIAMSDKPSVKKLIEPLITAGLVVVEAGANNSMRHTVVNEWPEDQTLEDLVFIQNITDEEN